MRWTNELLWDFARSTCEIYTTRKHSPHHSATSPACCVLQMWSNSQRWGRRSHLAFSKNLIPQDISVVMWKKKKGLWNVLLDGMAGMKNGNCFPFCTVSGKGNKNKKSISVGQHSQCLSWKSAKNRPTLCRPLSKNSYKVGSPISQGLRALSPDFGVPASTCESPSEEEVTFLFEKVSLWSRNRGSAPLSQCTKGRFKSMELVKTHQLKVISF